MVILSNYGSMNQGVEAALDWASDQVREGAAHAAQDRSRPRSGRAASRDASAGTSEQKVFATKLNEGIAQRAWLKHLPLGELHGANGLLGPTVGIEELLGSHVVRDSSQGDVDLLSYAS